MIFCSKYYRNSQFRLPRGRDSNFILDNILWYRLLLGRGEAWVAILLWLFNDDFPAGGLSTLYIQMIFVQNILGIVKFHEGRVLTSPIFQGYCHKWSFKLDSQNFPIFVCICQLMEKLSCFLGGKCSF